MGKVLQPLACHVVHADNGSVQRSRSGLDGQDADGRGDVRQVEMFIVVRARFGSNLERFADARPLIGEVVDVGNDPVVLENHLSAFPGHAVDVVVLGLEVLDQEYAAS